MNRFSIKLTFHGFKKFVFFNCLLYIYIIERFYIYIIERFWFQICFWQAHFSVSLKRSMMNGNGLYKHYKMDFWIKFRCAWHKNFVQKYLSEKNAAHIKNAAESLWDTKSKLMRRHALFPSIISHTSFVSLHNCPTLWPSFKIFPCAAIFHCIRNKYWTEFSFKVSVKFECEMHVLG